MASFGGVHTFGYRPNSAESEPILMKSGAEYIPEAGHGGFWARSAQ